MDRGTFMIIVAGLLGSVMPSVAQPPSYGIDFVTIGDPGNVANFLPDPSGVSFTEGRGSVPYEYRIGKMEITTSQWMEFANAYAVRGGSFSTFARPSFWGGEFDPTYGGPGVRYRLRNLPGAANFPVVGISWRECAQYCNWLHNEKATTLEAIGNGAYDASTFVTNPNGTFGDQWTHNPGAKFWIPTLDEWIKAVHYDPARNGPGQGGWWLYPHGSDSPVIYGPPRAGRGQLGICDSRHGHLSDPARCVPELAHAVGAPRCRGRGGRVERGNPVSWRPKRTRARWLCG